MGLRHPVPRAYLVSYFAQIKHYLYGSFAERNAQTWGILWVFATLYLGHILWFSFRKLGTIYMALLRNITHKHIGHISWFKILKSQLHGQFV